MSDSCIPAAGNEYHTQAAAQHPVLGAIPVDQEMVEVLESLWRCGINTLYSCQCSPSDQKGYIFFPSSRDAERFLQIAGGKVDSDPLSLFQRVRRTAHSEQDAAPDAWEIWTSLVDQANPHWIQGEADQPAFYQIRVSVRFPYADLAEIRSNLSQETIVPSY